MEGTKKHSVLVADDEKSFIMELTDILSPLYEVYAVKNGQDTIKTAEEMQPDVILLDIVMPDMDGYEVIYMLKSNEKTEHIPVIFVTGLRETDDEERGLHLGAADYISKPFSSGIVKLRVSNQIEILNHHRQIEQLSLTDQLTGLPNRRSFDIRLKTEWDEAHNDQTPISILVIDIDKFKNYNDTFGHQQGDEALKAVANSFVSSPKRSRDFTARWGGEEFITLLPNTDMKGALEVAEQIRKNIENLRVPCPQPEGEKVTASIGVSTWIQGDNSTVDKFISDADMALYVAKEKGRNQVRHCNSL